MYVPALSFWDAAVCTEVSAGAGIEQLSQLEHGMLCRTRAQAGRWAWAVDQFWVMIMSMWKVSKSPVYGWKTGKAFKSLIVHKCVRTYPDLNTSPFNYSSVIQNLMRITSLQKALPAELLPFGHCNELYWFKTLPLCPVCLGNYVGK